MRTDDDGDVTEGVRGTYLCHVLCELGATKLAPALRQIRKWLRANPDNVLLIENEDYITSADFVSAMDEAACSTASTAGRGRPGRRSGR